MNNMHETEYYQKIVQAKKQKRKNVVRNILISLIGVVLVGIYFMSPISRVQSIEVVGNVNISRDKVKELANVYIGQVNLLRPSILINHSLNQSNLFADTNISKSIDGHVRIDVRENRLLFYQINEGVSYFYDEQGNILNFDVDNLNPKKSAIPILHNSEGLNEDIMNKLVRRLSVLDPSVLIEISEITHSPLAFDPENFIFTMSGQSQIFIQANLDDLVTVGANYHSFSINTRYECSMIQFINSENRAIVRNC